MFEYFTLLVKLIQESKIKIDDEFVPLLEGAMKRDIERMELENLRLEKEIEELKAESM